MPVNILKGVPDSDVDEAVEDYKSEGATVTKIRENGTWKLIAVIDEPGLEGLRAPVENVAPLPDDLPETPPPVTKYRSLGVLSERYESNGKPGAIGRDRTGGFSYGMYQIATRTGTMKRFLKFLAEENPGFAAKLNSAGGADGALQGIDAFKSAWQELAKDSAFADAQHAFIQATHYEPFVRRTKEIDLDISNRSFALKNVAWSIAVQHGPLNSVFRNALSGQQPSRMNDESIINQVYDERSDVENYFRRSSDKVKASVKNRFAQERDDALKLLEV